MTRRKIGSYIVVSYAARNRTEGSTACIGTRNKDTKLKYSL